MSLDPAAFLSYAHEDNRLDNGGIINLANSLANEFSLISGQSLDLFVDRTGISWGDEWRSRINTALTTTTFFVPVLTPRYFARPECRRELIDFSTQAQVLGTTDLIMPILYAPISEFNDSNPDELIALASRFQHVDWSTLRLEGSAAPEFRKSVHHLAERLVEISALVAV